MYDRRTKICLIVSLILSLMAIFHLAIGSPLQAQEQEQKPRVSLEMKEEKEITLIKEEGKQTVERVPANEVKSLDTLVYSITYTNEGQEEARDISIVDPIPDGTIYIPESAEGKNTKISFSIDGGNQFQGPPVKYLLIKPDGTTEEQIAPVDMYTHIKWIITDTIPPGGGGQVSFKTKVK